MGGRSRRDGAAWARVARRGGTDPAGDGQDAQFLTVDPDSGALVVTGAGAAATATALRVQDGDTTRTAVVGEDRALLVRDVTAADAKVDAANFPATALAAGETFTGAWVDVLRYAAITVVVLVDQPSAANGAVVDFSADGVNVARSVSASIPANVGSYFSLAPEARFYRLRYTNGATALAAAPKGQVLLRFQPPALVEQPLGAAITDVNLAQINRAAVSGRLPDGRYLPVAITAEQRLLVSNGHTQPLTDAQLRAAAVPVATGLTQPLTDAQLAARLPLPVATPSGLATDAALVPLLDGLEALLTTLRDEQMRRTDPLVHGESFIGYVGESEEIATRQGRYRWSGGKAATSVVSPNASATLTNPLGSGVDLVLTRYSVEVDASADIVIVYDAVSSGTLMRNTNPNQRNTIVNPGECRVGSGVLTGGTAQDYTRRAGTQSPISLGPFRHRIPPGKTWTVRFLGPGAANNVWFVLGWYAVPEGAELT